MGGPSRRPVSAMAPDAAQAPAVSGMVTSANRNLTEATLESPVETPMITTIGLHAFLELAGSAAASHELSVTAGIPAVGIDLTEPPSGEVDVRGAARVLRGLTTVLVGVADGDLEGATGDMASLLDVVVADPAPLLRTVEQFPLASVTLVQVLRATMQLDLDAALAGESAAYSLLQAGPEFARWLATRDSRGVQDADGNVVEVARDETTLSIRLSRPDKHNALNTAMRDQLYEALVLAASDQTIGRVVIEGAGRSFCSGGDLDEFGSFPDPATAHVTRLARSSGRLIAAIAGKVEVRLHGHCMGAGIELPAFASRVVADPDTVIALPEIGLGLIPGAGGTVSLPRRIGRQRTCELALTQSRVDASTALSWGLVDEIAPRGQHPAPG
jgi:enoyl-CoA hydratase/carnithine racemase